MQRTKVNFSENTALQ